MGNYAKTEYIAFIVIWFFVLSTVLDDLGGHVTHGSTSFVALSRDPLVQNEW